MLLAYALAGLAMGGGFGLAGAALWFMVEDCWRPR